MGLVTESMGVAHEKSFWLAWRIRRDNWHTCGSFRGRRSSSHRFMGFACGFAGRRVGFSTSPEDHDGSSRGSRTYRRNPFSLQIRAQDPFSGGRNHSDSRTVFLAHLLPNLFARVCGSFHRTQGPQSVSPDPMWKPRFDLFREQQPVAPPKDWEPSASSHSDGFVLSIPSLPGDQPSEVRFFGEGRMIRSNAPQILRRGKQGWELLLTQSPWARKGLTHLSGLLYRREGWGTEENPSFYRLNLPLSGN